MTETKATSRSVRVTGYLGLAFIVAGLIFLRYEQSIHATGTVRAREELRLFAPADGQINLLSVTNGVSVTAGQPLAELDSTEWQLRLVQLQRDMVVLDAQIAAADIRLRELDIKPATAEMITAEARRERLSKIQSLQADITTAFESGHDDNSISTLDLNKQRIETLKTELDLLQAELLSGWQKAGASDIEIEKIRSEKSKLEEQRAWSQSESALLTNLVARLKIAAPFDGKVVSLPFRYTGQTVRQGEEIMRLAVPDGRYRVRALVGEKNVDLIRTGCRVLLESGVYDSILEGAITGTVYRVDPDASSQSTNAPLYEVLIDIESTPHPLVLGSTMDVRILLGRRSIASLFSPGSGRL